MPTERAVLITIQLDPRFAQSHGRWQMEDEEQELKELTTSSGCRIVGEVSAKRHQPIAGTFLGRGKLDEIAERVTEWQAQVVIFNHELSGAQQRNIEDLLRVKTIDRTQLILDIFAQRATSQEGKVQVELAQLRYLLPRLMGKGIMLSRLGGGIGTRGPGEQKLEVDRRRIRSRIYRWYGELKFLELELRETFDPDRIAEYRQRLDKIEEVAQWNKEYAISRWQTVSGSQYPFSPATITALPDARLIQTMTLTLLDAGENAVRPPLIATKDAVKSDVGLYSGGITWVDQDYDERLGEALRPLTQDLSGIPLGIDMMRDARQLIMQAFYLNKLSLPTHDKEMTAYEIGQRVQEYIRGAMPIFEPMEYEKNGQIQEMTFDLLRRGGAFGSMNNLPESLRGAEITFRFESPLHDAIEAQKGHLLMESGQMIAQAMQLDPTAGSLVNVKTALRDALDGAKIPAKWMNSEE